MGVPIFFGFRAYGRINQPDGTYRATKFFYLQGLPIFPIGGVQGVQGEDPCGEAPLHLLSILVAYFKVYAFFFTCFLTAIVWKILDDTNNWELWPMGLIPVLAMSVIVASWFWVGRSPGWSNVKRTFVMLFTMVFVVGPTTLPIVNAASIHRSKTRSEQSAAQAVTAAANQAKDAGMPKLKAVSAAHKAADPSALGKCNDAFLSRLESSFTYVYTVEAGYLAGMVGEGSLTRDNEWLVSRPLQVPQGGAADGDMMREVMNLNLMAVVHLDPPGAKGLSGYVTIHHVTNGKVLCGVKVPPPARPLAKDAKDAAKQAAFIESAQKALKGISTLLALKLDTPR